MKKFKFQESKCELNNINMPVTECKEQPWRWYLQTDITGVKARFAPLSSVKLGQKCSVSFSRVTSCEGMNLLRWFTSRWPAPRRHRSSVETHTAGFSWGRRRDRGKLLRRKPKLATSCPLAPPRLPGHRTPSSAIFTRSHAAFGHFREAAARWFFRREQSNIHALAYQRLSVSSSTAVERQPGTRGTLHCECQNKSFHPVDGIKRWDSYAKRKDTLTLVHDTAPGRCFPNLNQVV